MYSKQACHAVTVIFINKAFCQNEVSSLTCTPNQLVIVTVMAMKKKTQAKKKSTHQGSSNCYCNCDQETFQAMKEVHQRGVLQNNLWHCLMPMIHNSNTCRSKHKWPTPNQPRHTVAVMAMETNTQAKEKE